MILYCTMQLYDLVLYSSYMIMYCTVQLYDLVLYSAVIRSCIVQYSYMGNSNSYMYMSKV